MSSLEPTSAPTDADLSDSDSDATDSEDEQAEYVAIRYRELLEQPRNRQAFVDVISRCRAGGLRSQLRPIRQAFANEFWLTTAEWMTWIEGRTTVILLLSVCCNAVVVNSRCLCIALDELKDLSRSDKGEIHEVFELAFQDHCTVEIWLAYIDFQLKYNDLATDKNRRRDLFETAISRCGSDVRRGKLLWDAYLKQELLDLDRKLNKYADIDSDSESEDEAEAVAAASAAQQLRSEIKQLISIIRGIQEKLVAHPHSELEKSVERAQLLEKQFQDFSTEKESSLFLETIKKIADRSKAKLRLLQHHESRVVAAVPPDAISTDQSPGAWLRYIEFAKNQTDDLQLVFCVLERAVETFPHREDIWLAFLSVVAERGNNALYSNQVVLSRAVRACYMSEKLWGKFFDEMAALAVDESELFKLEKRASMCVAPTDAKTSSKFSFIKRRFCVALRRLYYARYWEQGQVVDESNETLTRRVHQWEFVRTAHLNSIHDLMVVQPKRKSAVKELLQVWTAAEHRFHSDLLMFTAQIELGSAATVEANRKAVVAAWRTLVDAHSSGTWLWLQCFQALQLIGALGACRQLFEKSLSAVESQQHLIAEEWNNFEIRYGSARTEEVASLKTAKYILLQQPQVHPHADSRSSACAKTSDARPAVTSSPAKVVAGTSNKNPYVKPAKRPRKSKIVAQQPDNGGQKKRARFCIEGNEGVATTRTISDSGKDDLKQVTHGPQTGSDANSTGTTGAHASEVQQMPVLFVKNLSFTTEDTDLKTFFRSFNRGTDPEVHVVKNRRGRSRGFAYVKFLDEELLLTVCSRRLFQLGGRNIMCERKTVASDYFATARRTIPAQTTKREPGNDASCARPRPKSVHPLTIFVRQVPAEVTEKDLSATFAVFGTVAGTRKLRAVGQALVQFADAASVAAILNSPTPITIGKVEVVCEASKFPAVMKSPASVHATKVVQMKPRALRSRPAVTKTRAKHTAQIHNRDQQKRVDTRGHIVRSTGGKSKSGSKKSNNYFAQLMGR